MKIKKRIILLTLVIFLLSLANAYASEMDDTLASEDASQIEVSSTVEDTLQASETLEQTDDNGAELKSTDEDELSSSGEFGELQKLIDDASDKSTINLERNYTYTIGVDNITEGIIISKNLTINGNGFAIDAQGKSRILNIKNGTNVVLNNIIFTNGYVKGYGGAILANGTVNIVGSTFTDNTAAGVDGFGGAVFFNDTGAVSNSNFTANHANNEGGAVYFNAKGSVENCNFKANAAQADGGAVYFDTSGTVENCNFSANNATSYGSAVRMSSGSVSNSNFTNNMGDHGAVNLGSGNVDNCNFVNNTASNDGGAVYIYKHGAVSNCNFTNNTAKNGNAIFISKGNISGCDFRNNYISEGAIHSVTGNVTLSNNILDVNDVMQSNNFTYVQNLIDKADSGDTIFIDGSYYGFGIPIRITKSLTLIGTNNATLDAKKLSKIFYITADNVTLKNMCFTNGYSQNGGAVYFNRTGIVENCNFINNTANEDGGAVYFNCSGTDDRLLKLSQRCAADIRRLIVTRQRKIRNLSITVDGDFCSNGSSKALIRSFQNPGCSRRYTAACGKRKSAQNAISILIFFIYSPPSE